MLIVLEHLSVQIAVAVKLAVPEVSVNAFKIEKPPPPLPYTTVDGARFLIICT